MADQSLKISRVRSGAELLRVWDECESALPEPEAWAQAIREKRNRVIAARIGEKAAGYVTIRWAGPRNQRPEETKIAELIEGAFPDDIPTPMLYQLYVQEQHRRLGIGTKLMLAAERSIRRQSDTANRAALSVELSNQSAIRLYEKIGYKLLWAGNNGMVEICSPEWVENEYVSRIEPGIVMYKKFPNEEGNT